MGLGSPRILYGVHSVSPYNQSDKTFYGILKVLGSANIGMTSSLEDLFAGANKFAWATEAKTISSEVKMKVKAYPDWLFQLFLGATVTDNNADTAGTVSGFANGKGTSLFNSTTGIATVTVKSASKANLKFGKYVLKVLTSTTVGIYLASDVDGARGTAVPYTDDTLALTDSVSPITITSGAGEDLADLGLTLTGGSGTIGMTVGDTAVFYVRPPSSGSADIVVGASTTSLPAFGAVFLAAKRGNGEMFEIDAPNCIGSGLPIDFTENAFSQPEISFKLLYDSTSDCLFKARHIKPS